MILKACSYTRGRTQAQRSLCQFDLVCWRTNEMGRQGSTSTFMLDDHPIPVNMFGLSTTKGGRWGLNSQPFDVILLSTPQEQKGPSCYNHTQASFRSVYIMYQRSEGFMHNHRTHQPTCYQPCACRQGAPYIRRYGRELVSKPVILWKRLWGRATVNRLFGTRSWVGKYVTNRHPLPKNPMWMQELPRKICNKQTHPFPKNPMSLAWNPGGVARWKKRVGWGAKLL